MRFTRFALLALAAGTLPLVGCGRSADDIDQGADEADVTGLEVTNARMLLPPVAGNPAAIYFDVANAGDRNVAIRTAAVEGAGRAEIHATSEWEGKMTMGEMGPVMIPAGGHETFEPGGTHVMVFDLDPSLAAGGTTDMTLTIAGGKSTTAKVAIQAAGDER